MSRGFSHKERQQLREQLIAQGRELFARYGVKKTTLRELTEPLGIAKSSFYIFFDSKEALYWHLLLEEGPKVEAKIRAAVKVAGDNTRAAIENLLRATIHEIETNKLYRQLIDHPEELQMVMLRLPPEKVKAKAQGSLALIMSYVQSWQIEDDLMDAHPEVIARALRAITLLTLHKDDIGPTVYPEVMELLIQAVAAGLTSTTVTDADNA